MTPPKSATVALHRPVPPSDFRCVSQLNDIKGVLQDDALPSFTKLILLGLDLQRQRSTLKRRSPTSTSKRT